jgi:hypothetical protein
MTAQSSIHFYASWAKERIDEMNAALTSLESKAGKVEAEAKARAELARADLSKKRDRFRDTVKNQAQASEAAWQKVKAQLDSEWNDFEADIKKYVESCGTQIEQQQATFKLQAEAQLKAWHDLADKYREAGKDFTADRRADIEACAKRLKADAAAAQEKLQKLSDAGAQSWSAAMAALKETRSSFDRASQAAHEAFKKAAT